MCAMESDAMLGGAGAGAVVLWCSVVLCGGVAVAVAVRVAVVMVVVVAAQDVSAFC